MTFFAIGGAHGGIPMARSTGHSLRATSRGTPGVRGIQPSHGDHGMHPRVRLAPGCDSAPPRVAKADSGWLPRPASGGARPVPSFPSLVLEPGSVVEL